MNEFCRKRNLTFMQNRYFTNRASLRILSSFFKKKNNFLSYHMHFSENMKKLLFSY